MVHRSPPDIDASLLSYLQDMAGNAEIENNDVLLEEALCMVESIVASGEISAANAGVIYSILLSLVKIGYKGDILNEGTLKAWRLFSKALVGGAVLADKRVLSEFGSLLSRYCEEGMMALCVNLDMTLNDLDSYIEQELTTMKLVGFFGLRLSELVFHKFKELNADNISASMSLLLRYTGILHTIGKHTSSISTLIAKSCQFFERMLSNDVEHLLPALLRSFASAEGFNETDRISSFYTILGALRVSLYLLQSMAAQEERTASIELVCGCIYLNIAAASILTMVHGGTLTDSDLLEIMGSAVDAICTTLGRLQSPQELVTAVVGSSDYCKLPTHWMMFTVCYYCCF